jgi:hypothetical protein
MSAGYDRDGDVFTTLPDLWPIFEVNYPHYCVAEGVPACAGMLLELGDVHVSVDDGFSHTNYLHPMLADRVAQCVRDLGGDPEKYRALRNKDGWASEKTA